MDVFLDNNGTEDKRFRVMVEDEKNGMFFTGGEDSLWYSILSDKDTRDPIQFIAGDEETVYAYMRDWSWVEESLNIDQSFLTQKFFVVEV